MKWFWCLFFCFWPIVAVISFVIAPAMGWWFPGESMSPLGERIDDLFYFILVITTIAFVGTQIALAYTLFRGAREDGRALFTHGSHTLEVLWTIVPAGLLLFIALVQMDVWADFRVKSSFPQNMLTVAEVTARQFEWRIRYPAPGKELQKEPQPDDLYAVNDLHVPTGTNVLIQLRTDDVQHSFFLPHLRVKQDAVPGLVIPVWFHAKQKGEYELLCAELCGWGHYKMRAQLSAQPESEYYAYLQRLQQEQNDDGFSQDAEADADAAEAE